MRRRRITGLLLLAGAAAACTRTGKLELVGTVRECPPAVGFSAQPLQQELGSDISLLADATDAGPPTGRLQWSQSEPRGRFSNAARPDATFTCTSTGSSKITLAVTGDHGCYYASSIEVRCVPVELCGNQRLDLGEACDGLLSPNGSLPRTERCASDCRSILDRCKPCEDAYCRDYHGQGTDLIAQCFEDKNPSAAQQCAALVRCAHRTNCAYGARGLEACLCGTAETAACMQGKGIDGPCRAELEAAAGSTNPAVVTGRLGGLDLAVGKANQLLQCDTECCRTTCVP